MNTHLYNEVIVTAMLVAGAVDDTNTPAHTTANTSDACFSVATLQQHFTSHLDKAKHTLLRINMPQDLVNSMDFAVCAFVDEILLASTTWQGTEQWMQNPLQYIRHGTSTAGEEFYTLLDELLDIVGKSLPTSPTQTSSSVSTETPSDTIPLNTTSLAQNPLDINTQLTAENTYSKSHIQEAQSTQNNNLASEHMQTCLTVFALCLAQGFTGMYYNNPQEIQTRYNALALFIPAISTNQEYTLQPITPERLTKGKKVLRTQSNFFKRFDLLDVFFWCIPVVCTALFYILCKYRLDLLLVAFLQGNS